MSPILKNIVAPLQTWLLSQNRCVGCGTPLLQALKQKTGKDEILICKCKRIYKYDKNNKSYRRALLTEI